MKYVFLAIFIVFLLFSGFINIRRTKTAQDFFIGGRKVGPWMSAFAYGTTYFSAVIFIGFAGSIGWGHGYAGLWIAIGNAFIGCMLAWWLLARRTREMTARLNAMTMPEFLKQRYDSPGMKYFAAFIIFVFLVPYSASVYTGLSYLFESVFNIPFIYATIGMALLTAAFLMMGGYFAVVLTDFFMGIVMIIGVTVMLYFIYGHEKVGGLANGISQLHEIDPGLTSIVGPPGWLSIMSLMLLTSLGPWALPQMVQKFYAIKDASVVRAATIVTTLFALFISVATFATGAVSRLFLDNTMPVDASGAANPDMIIPLVVTTVLPEIVVALILLLILSASLSTLSSLVLVSSSSIAIDFLGSVFPDMSRKRQLAYLRLLCLFFILISLFITIAKPTFILQLMSLSWGTVAGAFLAPYLYGLFWRKTTKIAAWVGAICGMSISIILNLYGGKYGITSPMAGSLAMLVPLLIVPIVSLLTQPLPMETVERAFADNDQDSTIPNGKQATIH